MITFNQMTLTTHTVPGAALALTSIVVNSTPHPEGVCLLELRMVTQHWTHGQQEGVIRSTQEEGAGCWCWWGVRHGSGKFPEDLTSEGNVDR